jgi:hypothetical protein
MTLTEIIVKVEEKNLTKDQLEDYHSMLSTLFAKMQIEAAEIEKAEALFLNTDKEKSVAQRKIEWKATNEGQRLIVLKRYSVAVKQLLNSLKSRLYSIY